MGGQQTWVFIMGFSLGDINILVFIFFSMWERVRSCDWARLSLSIKYTLRCPPIDQQMATKKTHLRVLVRERCGPEPL